MLRIQKYIIGIVDEIQNFDFTLISDLKKDSPSYEKGRKIKSTYTADEEIIVEKLFEDIFNEDGRLIALKMTINWYNEDGEIGETKEQIVKNFNKAESMTMCRKRRSRSIDWLIAASEGTAVEQYVKALFKHYANEIQLFISAKTNDFADAINNETIAPFTNYLDIVIEAPSELYPQGKKVKDSILEQIT